MNKNPDFALLVVVIVTVLVVTVVVVAVTVVAVVVADIDVLGMPIKATTNTAIPTPRRRRASRDITKQIGEHEQRMCSQELSETF